jgi:serine/threonine protein kinase
MFKKDETLEINSDCKYEYVKKIGKGRFGKIYLVLLKTKNTFHVIKHIKKKYTKNVQNEINILKLIQNKNDHLLTMNDYFILENNDIMILTDYIKNSIDLNEFISNNTNTTEIQYISIIKELLTGLKSLHNLNIVHMDIKPKNILIYVPESEQHPKNKSYKIKYIDFGFSCEKDNVEYLSRYRGTAQYMDPFMIEKKIDSFLKSKKADIWSLGVSIYKLVHRKLPWKNKEKDEIKQEIKNTDHINSLIPLYKPIIDNMIQKKTRKRFSLSKLLEIILEIEESFQK